MRWPGLRQSEKRRLIPPANYYFGRVITVGGKWVSPTYNCMNSFLKLLLLWLMSKVYGLSSFLTKKCFELADGTLNKCLQEESHCVVPSQQQYPSRSGKGRGCSQTLTAGFLSPFPSLNHWLECGEEARPCAPRFWIITSPVQRRGLSIEWPPAQPGQLCRPPCWCHCHTLPAITVSLDGASTFWSSSWRPSVWPAPCKTWLQPATKVKELEIPTGTDIWEVSCTEIIWELVKCVAKTKTRYKIGVCTVTIKHCEDRRHVSVAYFSFRKPERAAVW